MTSSRSKPFAPYPDGGWTYDRNVAAICIYRHEGDEADREAAVIIPDQVAADQRAFDGLAFPALSGLYVWLDGSAYDLHGTSSGIPVVRFPLPRKRR